MRRQQAHQLYRERRLPMADIAKLLGVSVWTVHDDIHTVQEALQAFVPLQKRAVLAEERQADIYEEIIIDTARQQRSPDKVTRRDARETLLQALRDEQRFYGIGKRDETIPAAKVVEMVLGLTGLILTRFSELVEDKDLQRQWAEFMRQTVRQRLGVGAIDVVAVTQKEEA